MVDDTPAPIFQLLVPGSRFWAIVAVDVTPFGPSDVTGAVVVVVLLDAPVVVVVVLLAADSDGPTMNVKAMVKATRKVARGECNTPRTAFTLPPRCCPPASVVSDIIRWSGSLAPDSTRSLTSECSAYLALTCALEISVFPRHARRDQYSAEYWSS
jgi:hypothetical protein